jgi:uridine kinase
MKINLIKNGSITKSIQCKKGDAPLSILKRENIHSKYIITAAKVNNLVVSLETPMDEDCSLEFLDTSTQEGLRVYQDSLTLVLYRAATELFGTVRVAVKHSLADGYYIEIFSRFLLTESDTEKLKKRMTALIEEDEPFERKRMSLSEVEKHLPANSPTWKLLQYNPKQEVTLYQYGSVISYFVSPLVPSAGFLSEFDIRYLPPGLILRFPTLQHPDKVGTFVHQPNLLKIFTEYERWGQILDVSYVASLNKKVENFEIEAIIQVSEALHEKKIARIADEIYEKQGSVRVIMIAGPSASGKTTFAKRLAIQLKTNGLSSKIISLDDYFVERDKTPLDKYGRHDFESIDALEKDLIDKQISALLAGEEVKIPKYNFFEGKREPWDTPYRLKKNELLIVEGIHGLNDSLTSSVPAKQKYKIYISALTQLNLDNLNRISTSDTRIIRRIVRDVFSRGHTPQETLNRWDSIRAGEGKYIFRFQEESDAMFNSALVYELGVLKTYAIPELKKVSPECPEYSEAQRLIKILSFFLSISEKSIPLNSIIWEFIGNKVLSR